MLAAAANQPGYSIYLHHLPLPAMMRFIPFSGTVKQLNALGYTYVISVGPQVSERHAIMEQILPGCRYTLRYNGMPL